MMAERQAREFQPTYAIPPGVTLRETLESLGLSQSDLAERTGRPKKTINEIVQGKAAITPETALQFEQVLGVPAAFWNNLERQYRATLALISERKQLGEHLGWLKEFPVAEMVNRGWISGASDQIELLRNLLKFFGVVSPQAWTGVWEATQQATAYRQSTTRKVEFGAVATWLRKGELEGRAIKCQPFDAAAFKAALKQIRTLTTLDPSEFCPKIQELCAAAGVALVFVKELPKAGMFGAARWLTQDKALIQLSLYYKREDQLWFSLFHEAAHILLHGRRDVFVDVKGSSDNKQEIEANEFAANYLIDPAEYEAFTKEEDFSPAAVIAFAKRIGIVTGIVVGRLEHDKHVSYSQLTRLKRSFSWAE